MARDGAGSVSLAPPRAVFARAVARGPADSDEAWQRIARLRSRRQAPLSQSDEQQSKHLALEPRSDATLVAMTMFPPLRLRPHRLGGRGIEPHSPRQTHRPASVLLQVMSERQRMRSARQHGPRPRCPPTQKAAALISSGRRRLGLRPKPKESNARPERMQGAQPHEEPSTGDVPRPVPSSARDVEAAAVVECLLARVRAGVMSEEQLQSELEAGGVPVPRQWRGQIRSAMKTAAWVEKRKIAPGLGKHQLTMPQGMAPADLQQCEAQLELELAIDMPQTAADRLALEESMRQEMAAALGIEPERLESLRITEPSAGSCSDSAG